MVVTISLPNYTISSKLKIVQTPIIYFGSHQKYPPLYREILDFRWGICGRQPGNLARLFSVVGKLSLSPLLSTIPGYRKLNVPGKMDEIYPGNLPPYITGIPAVLIRPLNMQSRNNNMLFIFSRNIEKAKHSGQFKNENEKTF